MSDVPVDSQPSNAGETFDLAGAVEDIGISLLFEVGRQEMPLKQLRSLQAGYVFELPANAARPVTVRANGKAIGRGELVKIGERIGVRLVEMNDG